MPAERACLAMRMAHDKCTCPRRHRIFTMRQHDPVGVAVGLEHFGDELIERSSPSNELVGLPALR